MRLLTLLSLLLVCTCLPVSSYCQGQTPGQFVRAQNSRIDTVRGPMAGTTAIYYVTEMPANMPMPKAERFMRGLTAGEEITEPWERLDSIVIIDTATGRRLSGGSLTKILGSSSNNDRVRSKDRAETARSGNATVPPTLVYAATNLVVLEGRIGERLMHPVEIRNGSAVPRQLVRVDESDQLATAATVFAVPAKGSLQLEVSTKLPEGAVTHPLLLTQGDSIRLEVRFSLNGHDINEADFVASPDATAVPWWVVPKDRETLYLRLRSTEKLMTVYRDGKVYNKVAVGRQLDELSLIGLAPGAYLLEVVDLGTGEKRYHGLRREPSRQ